jgi:PilZ domain
MSTPFHSGLRKTSRYRVNDAADISATIAEGVEPDQAQGAKLLDLSQGGAKLEVEAAFVAKGRVVVQIRSGTLQHAVELPAEIRWISPVPGGVWHIGCEFRQVLSDATFQEFLQSGVLDRRRHKRTSIQLSASARWEFNAHETSVAITDHSTPGGFRLLADSAGHPDSRVELVFLRDGRQHLIRGRIRWSRASADGFDVGCEFLGGRDASNFSRLLNRDLAALPSVSSAWQQRLNEFRVVQFLSPVLRRRQVRRPLVTALLLGGVAFVASFAVSNRPIARQFREPIEGTVVDMFAAEGVPPSRWLETPAVSGGMDGNVVPEESAVAFSPARDGADDVPSDTPAESLDSLLSGDPAAIARRPSEVRAAPRSQFQTRNATAVPVFLDRQASLPPHAKSRASVQQAAVANAKAAVERFRTGCAHYHLRRYGPACQQLSEAVNLDASDPRYHYVLALTLYQMGQAAPAERALAEAIAREAVRPLHNWGREMERFQGPSRMWLEQRRNAIR